MPPLPDENENRDSSLIENRNECGGVQCCIGQTVSLPQANNSSQEVGAGENSEKCRNALVRIFNSDKFSLLCDLLRNNFRDENSAERSNFGFGEIDVKIKNGDYEKSPHLFYNDIMKIGIDESDLDQSIDPCQARYCNHCHCEITNNWGLVSSKGCDTSYQTSCINPLIHGSTSSWYCSACIGKKPDVPVASGADGTDSDKEDNSETVQPCITSMYRLCKICGTRADRNRIFSLWPPRVPLQVLPHIMFEEKQSGDQNAREQRLLVFVPRVYAECASLIKMIL